MKFLIILVLIGYVIYRVGGFFFKVLFSASGGQRTNAGSKSSRVRPAGGNVNVDYVPDKESGKTGDFEGGQYVDYEEVK